MRATSRGQRRAVFVFASVLVVVVVVGGAACSASNDSSPSEPSSGTTSTSSSAPGKNSTSSTSSDVVANLARASRICKSWSASRKGYEQVFSSPLTAGKAVELLHAAQLPTAPWDSLPVDQFVAHCGVLPNSSATTTCPDGRVVRAGRPPDYYVDDAGREAPASKPGATDPCA